MLFISLQSGLISFFIIFNQFFSFFFRYFPCFSRDPNGTFEKKENFFVAVFLMDDRQKLLLHFCSSPILCDLSAYIAEEKGIFFLC